MSLWGTKKKDDNDNGDQPPQDGQVDHENEQEGMPVQRADGTRRREPNERDRLLPAQPRPPHADGYLDPDDPAVSD